MIPTGKIGEEHLNKIIKDKIKNLILLVSKPTSIVI